MASKEEALIKQYLGALRERGEKVPLVALTPGGDEVKLNCIALPPTSKLPKGFTISTLKWKEKGYGFREVEFQYDLRGIGGGRPKAYRVPFLLDKEFQDLKFTVSHLCHHPWCLNPRHHVLETLPDNKGRNGCPGGKSCCHRVRCLIPGPYYQGQSAVSIAESPLLKGFEV